MKNLKYKFTCQGLDPSRVDRVFNELAAAGMIHDGDPTPRELAALTLGITAPVCLNAAEHVSACQALQCDGEYLGNVMIGIFSIPPADIDVVSISVCHSFPMVRIHRLDGSYQEFTTHDFKPCPVRTETVISGGMISYLSMALHKPTFGGWAGE